MKLSPLGARVLSIREGVRTKSYKDTKGIWTVGIGDIDINNDGVRDVTKDTTLTMEQVISNFMLDVKWAEDCVNTNVTVPLTQNMFDSLVSFTFNIGATAFKYSTLLRMLNRKDYEGARKCFDMWHIPKSIISRRNSEQQQFMKDYDGAKKEI